MNSALVIVGASGVGKTTVANIILKDNRFSLVRSATTRKPREDGNDSEYIYLTREEFSARVENSEMLEFTEYGENLYGTPLSELERIFSCDKIPLLIVDLVGAVTFMKKALSFKPEIFYIYEDLNVIEKRLYLRDLATPTADGFTSFIRRKNANIKDYIRLPQIADGFTAFVKNTDSQEAADALLSLFFEKDSRSDLVTVGDGIKELSISLSKSAEAKL